MHETDFLQENNLVDYLIGNFIDKKCPECGAQLLGNKRGEEWCSDLDCDFGPEEKAANHDN